MKVKAMINNLNLLNPESEIQYRAYTNGVDGYTDLPFSDLRITRKGVVFSNQRGVE